VLGSKLADIRRPLKENQAEPERCKAIPLAVRSISMSNDVTNPVNVVVSPVTVKHRDLQQSKLMKSEAAKLNPMKTAPGVVSGHQGLDTASIKEHRNGVTNGVQHPESVGLMSSRSSSSGRAAKLVRSTTLPSYDSMQYVAEDSIQCVAEGLEDVVEFSGTDDCTGGVKSEKRTSRYSLSDAENEKLISASIGNTAPSVSHSTSALYKSRCNGQGLGNNHHDNDCPPMPRSHFRKSVQRTTSILSGLLRGRRVGVVSDSRPLAHHVHGGDVVNGGQHGGGTIDGVRGGGVMNSSDKEYTKPSLDEYIKLGLAKKHRKSLSCSEEFLTQSSLERLSKSF